MNTVGVPPEADLNLVAGGDFSGLSMPLLVAAHDARQLEDFVFRSGLVCSNVHRVRPGMVLSSYPENKVMILLPGYWENESTARLVDHWVNELDRYTCELQVMTWSNAMAAGIIAVIALVALAALILISMPS